MAKEAWETLVAYKLVWVRVAFFLVAPMITQFMAINQTVDMDTKWTQMGAFARAAFWIGIAYPGLNSLIAFIDQSMHRAKEGLERKRTGQTEFFTKPDSST